MCRKKKPGGLGGRRCPACSDPTRRALAHAVQRLGRWERRQAAAEAAGDATAADHALERLVAAVNDITERSTRITELNNPSPPPLPDLDPFELRSVDHDDLETMWGERASDPQGQWLIEREWDRRDALDRGSPDLDLIPSHRYKTLVDELHMPEDMSDRELKEAWLDCHTDPDLRERAEAEIDRRMLDRSAHPADDPDLADAIEDRLDAAWTSMRAADYRRYEATLVTDPSLRLQAAATRVPTMTGRQLRTDYEEYRYERFLAAEEATRGHMLNRRGQALGIDPFSLLSGNAKRMKAYASEEYLGFIGSSGGHMSFARFKAARTVGDYDRSRVEEFRDAVSV